MHKTLALLLALAPTLPVAQTLEVSAGALGSGATGRMSVAITEDLASTRDLPTEDLRQARKRMIARQHVPLLTIRDLADAGDSLAAYRFADAIADWQDPPLTADAAHYYARAAGAGRSGALTGMIKQLDLLDPATTAEARLRTLREVLVAYAVAGDPRAVKATLRYHLAGAPFGAMDDTIAAIVARGAAGEGPVEGADALALQLATEILQEAPTDPAEIDRAKAFLAIALRSDSVSILAIAQNLSAQLETTDLAAADIAAPTGDDE